MIWAIQMRHWRGSMVGSVSKVETMSPITLNYKVLFSDISTFETPPPRHHRRATDGRSCVHEAVTPAAPRSREACPARLVAHSHGRRVSPGGAHATSLT